MRGLLGTLAQLSALCLQPLDVAAQAHQSDLAMLLLRLQPLAFRGQECVVLLQRRALLARFLQLKLRGGLGRLALLPLQLRAHQLVRPRLLLLPLLQLLLEQRDLLREAPLLRIQNGKRKCEA